MTEQARLEAFQAALQQLEQQFGVTLIAVSRVERHGEQVQITPSLQAVLIPNWDSGQFQANKADT